MDYIGLEHSNRMLAQKVITRTLQISNDPASQGIRGMSSPTSNPDTSGMDYSGVYKNFFMLDVSILGGPDILKP